MENNTRLTDEAFLMSDDVEKISIFFAEKLNRALSHFGAEDRDRMSMLSIISILEGLRGSRKEKQPWCLDILAPISASFLCQLGADTVNDNAANYVNHILCYIQQDKELGVE